MSIWRFIRRDFKHVTSTIISLVVMVGIVVVPSFYAWFNIAGSWDPYGNTKNLKVAVANTDAGYTSSLMPVEINFGERVTANLRESESIGYVVTSEEDAVEGVKSGTYYAAIVIPEDFSEALMTAFSDSPTHAQVRFIQNEKVNPIAGIVTNKAATAVQQDIDESFASAVTTAGTGVLEQLGSALDDDTLSRVAGALDTAVASAQSQLTGVASDVRGFSTLLASTQGLLGSSSSLSETNLTATLDVGATLRDTASGVRQVGDALDGTTTSINDAISQSVSGIDAVSGAVDNAFDVAGGQLDALQQGLASVKEAVDWQVTELQKLSDALAGTDTLYSTYEESFSKDTALGTLGLDQIHETRVTISGLNDRVTSALSELRELSSQLDKTSGDLSTGATDAVAARAKLQGLVASAKDSISGVASDYESNVKGSLQTLAGQIESAATDAEKIVGDLETTLHSVGTAGSEAADGLGRAGTSLDETATALEDAASKLGTLHTRLASALESEDLETVRSVLSASPDALAAFISSPVSVDRNAIYPIENNGSAMAPFYSTLAIWIGGVVLAALVKANPSEKALRETGCGHGRAYVGRLVLFVLVGLVQAALICGGDLFYLGVQCEHPWLFLLACWAASFAFVNIIFAPTSSFGDVGKAVAVVLMVIQVAGSGGTFPREMLPQAFQNIYPYLPFVHAENAMRAALFGTYGADFWQELGLLLAFVVPSLLLGLVLRRPIIRATEWMEHQLESTKVM